MKTIRDPENLEGKTLHHFVDVSNQRVLEVGCGEGRLTWKYAGASSLTVGFDPDHSALRIARADSATQLKTRDESRGTYVHFIGASAKQIPFSKETFDIAVLAWSL